jgi:hypothetical protein
MKSKGLECSIAALCERTEAGWRSASKFDEIGKLFDNRLLLRLASPTRILENYPCMSDLNDLAFLASARMALKRIGASSERLLRVRPAPDGLTGEVALIAEDRCQSEASLAAASWTALAEATGRVGLVDVTLDDPNISQLADFADRVPTLALLRLALAPARQSEADRAMFDVGFVRLAMSQDPWPIAGLTSYLRSDLVTDLHQLGEPTGGVVSMSTLGSNGRFGNQLFQWAFLKLYALRSNCHVQSGRWIGNQIYDAYAAPSDPALRRQVFIEFTGIERTLWLMDEPPVNLDFQGFFQELPISWRRHKALFRLLFRPKPAISRPIDLWLAQNLPPESTTVGIHIRRGDYLAYDHQRIPWFRPIPLEWYRALLSRVWPTLERPSLILATDEASLVRDFHDYNPIVLPAPLLADEAIQYFPDFHALSRCHLLTVTNSSFSRMAALQAHDSQRRFLPNMATGVFEPYDPWTDDAFWERFESF